MFIWGLFRGLQSINNLSLIESRYIGFPDVYFEQQLKISQIDIFKGEKIIDHFFDFNLSIPLSPHFDEIDMGSMNYL